MASEARLMRYAPWAMAISVLSMVAIVVWFQIRQDINILDDLRGFDARLILPALWLHVLMHVLWSLRLRVLGGGLGVPLGGLGAWRLATSGQFAGAVTPGRWGAEAMRLTLLLRSGAGAAPASRMVLADRTSDMVFFLGAGTVGTILLVRLFGPEAAALRVTAIVALALLLGLMVLLFGGLYRPRPIAWSAQRIVSALFRPLRREAPDVEHRIEQLFHEVRTGVVSLLVERPMRVALVIVLSLLVWAAEFGVLWLVVQGFGYDLPYEVVFAAGILLTILGPIAVSPGGAGVVEVAAVVLIGSLAPGLSPAFVLVWRSLTFYYDVIVGGVVAGVSLRRPALA